MKKTLLFFIFSINLVFAQPKVDLKAYQSKYPSNDLLTLNLSEKINVEIVNGKIEIINEFAQDNLFLTNRAGIGNNSDRAIGYSPFFQDINNIVAATYIPDGKGFKKISTKEITTEKATSRGVFYDDYLIKKVTYLGLTVGAISTLKYEEVIKDPHMMSSFAFGNYIPIENAEFSVTFPADVKVSYKTFGDFSKINFTETKSRKKTTYTWKAQQINEQPYEPKSLNIRYYVPQVQLFIENYTVDGKVTEVLSDEKKLFNYYVSLVKDINKTPDKQLVNLVDSLTAGKTQKEKIKSVYYWVQDHVKYIAFEDGMGGFIPRQANDVCNKRYGDCKDMASLITTMLRLGGLKDSYLCWIGTRDIPFKYKENSSLSVDNHMIAVTKLNNEYYFLDATDDRIDFGLPTNHIQGKEGMIMLSETEYKILDVPIVKAKDNARKDSVFVKIEGNLVKGKGTTTIDGLWKTNMKYYLSNYSEKQKQEYVEGMFKVGNNKCKVGEITFLNLKERDKKLGFQYDFTIPDHLKNIDNELFINPHLFKHQTAESLIESTRKSDYEQEYTWLEETVLSIEIPENFQVGYLPEAVNYNNQAFGFALSYAQKGKNVVLNQRTYRNNLVLKKEEFSQCNEMITKMLEAYNEMISFKKTK
jgi:Domain of Unknown Function with PDB structure (DUF3857)/Transglutaminase-like superfamily